MLFQLKIKRDTAADFQSANTVLADGEFGLETDTGKMKVGNGSTAYNSLQFVTEDDATVVYTPYGTTKGYSIGGGSTLAYQLTFASASIATVPTSTSYGQGGAWKAPDRAYAFGRFSVSNDNVNNSKILKFPFATNSVSAVTGIINMKLTAPLISGHPGNPIGASAESSQWSSQTVGYTSGGAYGYPWGPGGITSYTAYTKQIGKFVFASDSDNTTVATTVAMGVGASGVGATMSSTHGYGSGGLTPLNTARNTMYKFPFASDSDSWSDIGDLTTTTEYATGLSINTHGYNFGGANPGATAGQAVTNKFPFASDSNASATGDLLTSPSAYSPSKMSGINTVSVGWLMGGFAPSGAASNEIQQWSFSSDSASAYPANLPATQFMAKGVSS